jgi:hypothetical protein
MPKKFSIADKNRWLERYESGKSEASIASDCECDVRTVRKGIEEARRERDARTARIDLLKQALFKHQENLLDKLREILSALTVPPKDWAVLSWHRNGDSIFSESNLDTENTRTDEVRKVSGYPGTQADMVQDMLRQHLRNDKLWKILVQREKVYASHRLGIIAFQRKVVRLLEEETGYKLMESGDVASPFLYSYTTGDLFFRMTLHCAFGDYKNDEWQDEIIVDTSAGYVKYHGSILAEVPGKEGECRKKLLDAFRKMQLLPEVVRVANTYRELEESTLRARQAIEEIRLLGLIPGRCKVCRRLGM